MGSAASCRVSVVKPLGTGWNRLPPSVSGTGQPQPVLLTGASPTAARRQPPATRTPFPAGFRNRMNSSQQRRHCGARRPARSLCEKPWRWRWRRQKAGFWGGPAGLVFRNATCGRQQRGCVGKHPGFRVYLSWAFPGNLSLPLSLCVCFTVIFKDVFNIQPFQQDSAQSSTPGDGNLGINWAEVGDETIVQVPLLRVAAGAGKCVLNGKGATKQRTGEKAGRHWGSHRHS